MGRYKLHGSFRASHLLVVRAQQPVISLERMHSALVVSARVQRNFHSAAGITMRPLVLAGPSGVGKSTLVKRLQDEFPGSFGFSVSHTTREPRKGEEDGVHYHFVKKDKFEKLVEDGAFIEHAQYGPNNYGTSKKAIQKVMDDGQVCVLDIDCQGVRLLKQTDLNPRYVFISPPSVDDLRKRLEGRGSETEESLKTRLDAAAAEIEFSKEPGVFDRIIINDVLDQAYKVLRDLMAPDLKKYSSSSSLRSGSKADLKKKCSSSSSLRSGSKADLKKKSSSSSSLRSESKTDVKKKHSSSSTLRSESN